MIESVQLYFNLFRSHSNQNDEKKISYVELLGISWSLHILYALYSVITLYLSIKSYLYFSSSTDFGHLMTESFSSKLQKISLLTTLFTVIFYPFVFQFAYKFWKGIFKFYLSILDPEKDYPEELADEILSKAFSANLFLMFPIVGNFLSNITMFYFLFQGARDKYGFTSLQATLVLITPVFLLFLFSVFTASYFLFLFTLL